MSSAWPAGDFRDNIPRVKQVREACVRGPISALLVGIGVEGFGDAPFIFLRDSTKRAIEFKDRYAKALGDVTEPQRNYEVRLLPNVFVV